MSVPPGIAFLDHTADVGLALEAASLDRLFHRAALGMLALLRGQDDGDEDGDRSGVVGAVGAADREPGRPESGSAAVPVPSVTTIRLEASTRERLLADWLRELLYLHGTRGRDYVRADFDRLDATGLRARVVTEPTGRAVREIKGVTYHDLVIEENEDGWRARVIFDV